jgi:hypothetical protein
MDIVMVSFLLIIALARVVASRLVDRLVRRVVLDVFGD